MTGKNLALTVGVASAAVGGLVLYVTLQDTITILEQSTSTVVNDVTVYVTGNHWGGCFCMFGKGGEQKLGNVTAGPSQVAALSATHNLFFDPDVHWNGLLGDKYTYTIGPPVDMPVKVWTLSGGTTATDDLAFAKTTLTNMKTGINLVSKGVTAPSLQLTTVGCEDLPRLQMAGAFDAAAVNIYYAETASCSGSSCESMGGQSCANRQVNFVYSIGAKNVMLHELGHALLGPDHWKSSTVGLDNIMNDASSERTSISTGQAIFMNYDQHSVFNSLRGFTGGLDCNSRCPRVDLDESWADCVPPTGLVQPQPSPTEEWFNCVECTQGQLERVVTDPNESVVVALAQPFAVKNPDDAERANVLAGRQRRAVIALTRLALNGNAPARQAFIRAYESRAQYRPDVMRSIIRAFELQRIVIPAAR